MKHRSAQIWIRSVANHVVSPVYLLFVMAWVATSPTVAEEGLSHRIDQTILQGHLGPTANRSSDAEFVRRVYLNFVGRTPSFVETTEFLESSDAAKRSRLIDRLVGSAEFDRYFARVIDVMWMERRSGKRIPPDEWLQFLTRMMSAKKPLNHIVEKVLTADGTGPERGAARFLLDREVEPNALTRDVGRIFLGRDLQCAQCHDHPLIGDYLQSEYYGIFAFLNRSYLFEESSDTKRAVVGEKAEGITEFSSVFAGDDDATQTLPVLLGGHSLEIEPSYPANEAYLVAPSKNAAAIPRFSRRAQLARLITHPGNRYFARNTANRLWAHLFGRGIVDPVDFHHSDNPPSQPELLRILANELVRTNYDIRLFFKQIAQSDTYQRAVDFPALDQGEDAEWPSLQALKAKIDTLEAAIEADTDSPWQSDRGRYLQQLADARAAWRSARQEVASLDERLQELDKQLDKARESSESEGRRLSEQTKQRDLLKQALDAAANAAKALPDDKGLQETQNQLQMRLTQLKQKIDATGTAQEASIKKAKAVAEQQTAAIRELVLARAEQLGRADMVAEARGAYAVFVNRSEREANLQLERQQRLKSYTRQLAWRTAFQRKTHLNAQYDELDAVRVRVESQRQQLDSRLADHNKQLAQYRRRITTAERLIATNRLQSKTQQEVTVALDATLRQAETLQRQFKDTQPVLAKASIQQLASSSEQLASDQQAASRRMSQLTQLIRDARHEIERLESECHELAGQLADANERLQETKHDADALLPELNSAALEFEAAEEQWFENLEGRFLVRSLSALTPEQLAGSTISALELNESFRLASERDWDKKRKKALDKQKQDPNNENVSVPVESNRETEIEAAVGKRIDGVFDTFISLFAAPAGAPQDVFSATADQALFVANDNRVQSWLRIQPGNLLDRLDKIEKSDQLAVQLYLALLNRRPSGQEVTAVVDYFSELDSKQRRLALQNIAWGLLSSVEFRFNH